VTGAYLLGGAGLLAGLAALAFALSSRRRSVAPRAVDEREQEAATTG
jgi:hypothetical protein